MTPTVTEEMIEACIVANTNAKLFGGNPRDWVRAGLTAALSLQPNAVKVRALVWREGNPGSYTEVADSPFGHYSVWEINGTGCWAPWKQGSGTIAEGGLAGAKAAAQADYTARIMSALDGATPSVHVTALNDIKAEAYQREAVPSQSATKDAIRGTALALSARLGAIERMCRAALSASNDVAEVKETPADEAGVPEILPLLREALPEDEEDGNAYIWYAGKCRDIITADMVAELEAALRTPAPVTHSRVKPLEWSPEDVMTWTDRDGVEHPASSYWDGKSPIACYQVSKFTDERFPKVSRRFCLRIRYSTQEQEFDTLDQAKDAAETHYRQQVEALLTPSPQPKTEGTATLSPTQGSTHE